MLQLKMSRNVAACYRPAMSLPLRRQKSAMGSMYFSFENERLPLQLVTMRIRFVRCAILLFGKDSTFLCLVQDNFLTQHVSEPTRAARVLDIVLSSQKEFVDNVEIQEPLGSSDHNQLHFNINIKSDKTKVKQCRRDFRKGNYREIRKNLAHIDWDEKMKNKTAT